LASRSRSAMCCAPLRLLLTVCRCYYYVVSLLLLLLLCCCCCCCCYVVVVVYISAITTAAAEKPVEQPPKIEPTTFKCNVLTPTTVVVKQRPSLDALRAALCDELKRDNVSLVHRNRCCCCCKLSQLKMLLCSGVLKRIVAS
jgi:hypothetical protein